jgi:hypothetical protein
VSDNGEPPERYGRGQHPNSRAQLKPGAGQWKPGQPSPHLKHGLRSGEDASPEWRRMILAPAADEIVEALADAVPLKGPDGRCLPQFRPAVEAAALLSIQVRRCVAYLSTQGDTDERGRLRPEVEQLDRATARYLSALRELGATPLAVSKLGLNVAHVEDLAVRRARDLEEADRDGEETA